MDIASRAKAALARLTARRFGRPVPRDAVEEALRMEGVPPAQAHEATEKLVEQGSARAADGGILPTSPPLATRAPAQVASFSRLHR